mmetsp:Transcript_70893/g.198816  ORF Transcript_70893/g.198816 Transcript_70893/m.198816 type:complete len:81 (+) Transcript_70893:941-1183(+)
MGLSSLSASSTGHGILKFKLLEMEPEMSYTCGSVIALSNAVTKKLSKWRQHGHYQMIFESNYINMPFNSHLLPSTKMLEL